MRGLIFNSERHKNDDFMKNINQFCLTFKDCMLKAKSPDQYIAYTARDKLQKMQYGLQPEQKMMIQTELRQMEKRSKKMTSLAMKSQDRRVDWINHTLNVISENVNKGGKRQIEQAKTIASAFYYGVESPKKPDFKAEKKSEVPLMIDSALSSPVKAERFLLSTSIPNSPIARKPQNWTLKYKRIEPQNDLRGAWMRAPDNLKTIKHRQMEQLRRVVSSQPHSVNSSIDIASAKRGGQVIILSPRKLNQALLAATRSDSLYDEKQEFVSSAEKTAGNTIVTFRDGTDLGSRASSPRTVQDNRNPVTVIDQQKQPRTQKTFTRSTKLSPRSQMLKDVVFSERRTKSRQGYEQVSQSYVHSKASTTARSTFQEPFVEAVVSQCRSACRPNTANLGRQTIDACEQDLKKDQRETSMTIKNTPVNRAIFGKRFQNRAHRANLVSQLRQKRCQGNVVDSLRSATHENITSLLTATFNSQGSATNPDHQTGLNLAARGKKLSNHPKRKVSQVVDLLDVHQNPDRTELVQKFLDNTSKNQGAYAGLGRRSIFSENDASVVTGDCNEKSSTRPMTKEDAAKYRKKTYHISVRSKISPQIFNLAATHKDFNNDALIQNRQRICKLLRSDSDDNRILKQVAAQTEKGVLNEGEGGGTGNLANPSQMSMDFSEESDGAGLACEDDNEIDKAFKRLQKKKDQFQRFLSKRHARNKEKQMARQADFGANKSVQQEMVPLQKSRINKKSSHMVVDEVFGTIKQGIL